MKKLFDERPVFCKLRHPHEEEPISCHAVARYSRKHGILDVQINFWDRSDVTSDEEWWPATYREVSIVRGDSGDIVRLVLAVIEVHRIAFQALAKENGWEVLPP